MKRPSLFLGIAVAFSVALASCQSDRFALYEGSVGEQIKQARKDKGWSKSKLAQTVGLTAENISTIEAGKAVPTRDIISEIENELMVEIILDNY